MTGIDPALFELFREEVRAHSAALGARAARSGGGSGQPRPYRAAHAGRAFASRALAGSSGSISAVRLAHVMEDALVAAQRGKIRLTPPDIDTLLKGTDLLATARHSHPRDDRGVGAQRTPRRSRARTHIRRDGGRERSIGLAQRGRHRDALAPGRFRLFRLPAAPGVRTRRDPSRRRWSYCPNTRCSTCSAKSCANTIAHRNGRRTGCGSREYEADPGCGPDREVRSRSNASRPRWRAASYQLLAMPRRSGSDRRRVGPVRRLHARRRDRDRRRDVPCVAEPRRLGHSRTSPPSSSVRN